VIKVMRVDIATTRQSFYTIPTFFTSACAKENGAREESCFVLLRIPETNFWSRISAKPRNLN
jgi:hypothetical protein